MATLARHLGRSIAEHLQFYFTLFTVHLINVLLVHA